MSDPTTTGSGSPPWGDVDGIEIPGPELAEGQERSVLVGTNRTVTPAECVENVVLPSLPQLLAGAALEDLGDPIDYDRRNRYVLLAVGAAVASGIPVGFRIDPSEPEWPVVYFELASGQVSWHLPQHTEAWDGHSTPEKDRRIDQYLLMVEEATRAG